MNKKNCRQSHLRGWLPNDPRIGLSNSTKDRARFHLRVKFSLSTLGAFMIVPSLLSAVFGMGLVSAYLGLPSEPDSIVLYSGLFVGILSLATFALGLYSGLLLLAGKHFGRAITSIVLIFCFGVATLLLPLLEGLSLQSGVIVAAPMFISSLVALAWTALNMAHQRATPTLILQNTLSIRERVFAVSGAAGSGLILLGILFHFTPLYPFYADKVLLIIGAPLLVAALLVRRSYKH